VAVNSKNVGEREMIGYSCEVLHMGHMHSIDFGQSNVAIELAGVGLRSEQ